MKVTNLFTAEDREVFDRIDRDCLAMHVVPPPKMFLKLEVRDGAGELTDVYEDRAHSWVRNAYNVMAYAGAKMIATGYGEGFLSIKSTSGSVMSPATITTLINQGTTSDADGIVVGSGNAAESFESFALESLIANGTSAGLLTYTPGSLGALVYDSETKKWTATMSRVFNNNSGADIIVREVGTQGGGASRYLTSRDVLAETKTVPNAGQLTVTYTIEMTFPA